MIKTLLTFLVIALSSLACLGQLPDSIKINDEWRYVYPVQESIDFSSYYYYQLRIRADEFPIWMEWKMSDDPRAKLNSKKLHKAIYAEKYKRKEVRDSIPLERDLEIQKTGLKFAKEYEEKGKIYYELDSKGFSGIPPVSKNLPSGKYVQFYLPYVTLDKGSKQQKVRDKVCVLFELKNNELHNQFTRFNITGDTLTNGTYDKSLKVGLWQESLANGQYNSMYGAYISFGNYISGLKEGEFRKYFRGELYSIKNYKNELLVGKTTLIDYRDSIVYDEFQALDVWIDYGNFSQIRRNDFIPGFREKIKLKFLPEIGEIYRIAPELMKTHSVKLKSIKDSTQSNPENSLVGVRVTRSVPCFDTYYKVYDRKTQKLIYSCYLDTVTRKFSGSSWFSNGKQFDTIWTDGTQIHRIVYDLLGNELKSTLNKKTPIRKFINGYEVNTSFSIGNEEIYYYLNSRLKNNAIRNDTVFEIIQWDQFEKLKYARFQLVNDPAIQEMIYLKEGLISHKIDTNTYVSIYKRGEIELTISEINHDRSFSLKINGVEYEGPIEISEKPYFQWTIQLLIDNKKVSFSSEPMNPGDFFSIIGPRTLGFFNEDVLYKGLSGHLKGNRLEGKVVLTDRSYNKRTELDYRNGMANGIVTIWESKSKRDQKEIIRNFEADSTHHFSTKGLKKIFMAKSMQLENGMLNGNFLYYFSNGDTSGVIPFKNGLKEGNAFRYYYRGRTLTYREDLTHVDYRIESATFPKDESVGKLLIREKSFFGSTFDTLGFANFDKKGGLITGLEIVGDFSDDYYSTGEVLFRKRPDGAIDFKRLMNGVINESGVVYQGFYLLRNEYVNGIINTTEMYEDSTNISFSSGMRFIYQDNAEEWILYQTGFYQSSDEVLRLHLTEDELMLSHSLSDNQLFKPKRIRYQGKALQTYYFKKYFPNGIVSREGNLWMERHGNSIKKGVWKVNNYNGHKQYELVYFDSLVKLGDQEWKIIGVQTDFDTLGNEISKRYVLFEDATYQCSSDDYYTERQFVTIAAKDPTKMNGLAKNYYDNGALMNEGEMKNGLPEGLWKFYAPDGKLKRLGRYVEGKQNGKWLAGDLDEKAYIGGVCIDPDNPYYEFNVHSLENDKEIEVTVYKNGEILTRINYGKSRNEELEIRTDIELR